jgi:hypothetical protein
VAGGGGFRQDETVAGRLAGIYDFHDEICLRQLGMGARHAGLLDGVGGRLAQTGGIDQAQREALEIDHLLDGVAGGAGLLADNGALKPEQAVQ